MTVPSSLAAMGYGDEFGASDGLASLRTLSDVALKSGEDR